MAKSERDEIIDEYVADRNSHIGEVMAAQSGEYPPKYENLYGAVVNEWVTTDVIRHYVDAIGDRNPLFRSEDYARGTRWGGIIAPATITDSIAHYVPGMREPGAPDYPLCKNLRPEVFEWVHEWMPRGFSRQLFRPIHAGDRFRVVDMFLGLEETEPTRGNARRQFIKTVRRHFINQREELVAIVDHRYDVLVDDVVDNEHPYYPGRDKIRRVTDEERDAITKGYDEEKIRGAEIRFWEDAKVGDLVDMLAVGPVSVEDVVAMFVPVGGHAVGFEIEWERIKLNPRKGRMMDPEINAFIGGPASHFYEAGKLPMGSSTGGPPIGMWCQMDALLSRLLYRWMGDDGFLKRFSTEIWFYLVQGEALYSKGKVTKKYVEGDEHLIDLDISMENHEKLVLATGSATVRLLSRTATRLV